MKVAVLCVIFVVYSAALPTDEKPEVQIIRNEFNNRGDKGYDYA